MNRSEEIAEYYDTNDTPADMGSGDWEQTPPGADPMVTTSLRLPKSLLDATRARADEEGVQTAAWIRAVVERALAEPVSEHLEVPGLVARASSLPGFPVAPGEEAHESASQAERLRKNAEITGDPPVGSGPLTMAEIVEAVRAARGQRPE